MAIKGVKGAVLDYQGMFIWGIFAIALVFLLVDRSQRSGEAMPWLYAVFFISGIPALIYQIVWQRTLFTLYGVNIESVTVVVTAFMLGLGVGSLLGGYLSSIPNFPLIIMFGFAELCIAAYGLMSLRLFRWIAAYTAGTSALLTGVLAFGLVLVPTVLMGATLPLLVTHFVRNGGNVGQSVSRLYFVNTLGSAIACLMAASFLMRLLGQSGSVAVAATMNVCVGASVLILQQHYRLAPRVVPLENVTKFAAMDGGSLVPFTLAVVAVALTGFIALGYEILWYRLFSFATGGKANSFALLLGSYLMGVAVGAYMSEGICARVGLGGKRYITIIGWFAVVANVGSFLVAPVLANTVAKVGLGAALPLILVAAGFLGAIFPLIAHSSLKADVNVGRRLAYLYFANILGAASGSFIVGFILLDQWSSPRVGVLLAVLGLIVGTALLHVPSVRPLRIIRAITACGVAVVILVRFTTPLFANFYEKLQFKKESNRVHIFRHITETRSGIVTVSYDGTVFGGGVYDGRFNTDLVQDSNMIVRCFAISAFHSKPREVLMVGLSSGSWAQVIANHPQVEHLTIVEINPGYLRLIPQYPQVASLLTNPKVTIFIDDGRRWLARNPARKFDLIVMNTTYYWRAHVSNLLSREFLLLVRQHLRPGGIHFYNTTGSSRVQFTGISTFPYSLRVVNFLAVSDTPIRIDRERWRSILLSYRIDEKPVLDMTRASNQERLNGILAMVDHLTDANENAPMEFGDSMRRRFSHERIITDDNMGLEWQ